MYLKHQDSWFYIILLLQSEIPGRPTSLAVYSPLDLPRLLLQEIRYLREGFRTGKLS